jgi:hypothetical protein
VVPEDHYQWHSEKNYGENSDSSCNTTTAASLFVCLRRLARRGIVERSIPPCTRRRRRWDGGDFIARAEGCDSTAFCHDLVATSRTEEEFVGDEVAPLTASTRTTSRSQAQRSGQRSTVSSLGESRNTGLDDRLLFRVPWSPANSPTTAPMLHSHRPMPTLTTTSLEVETGKVDMS